MAKKNNTGTMFLVGGAAVILYLLYKNATKIPATPVVNTIAPPANTSTIISSLTSITNLVKAFSGNSGLTRQTAQPSDTAPIAQTQQLPTVINQGSAPPDAMITPTPQEQAEINAADANFSQGFGDNSITKLSGIPVRYIE